MSSCIQRLASASLAVLALFCLLVATDRHAYAYVDPGTGYLALQSLASAVAAGAYLLRRRIAGLFARRQPAQPEPTATATPLPPRPATATLAAAPLASSKARRVA